MTRSGDRAAAREVLEKLRRKGVSEEQHPVAFAIALVSLGENEKALELLERAEANHDIGLLTAASPLDDPMYAPVRRHPRFIRLMERMKLSRS